MTTEREHRVTVAIRNHNTILHKVLEIFQTIRDREEQKTDLDLVLIDLIDELEAEIIE